METTFKGARLLAALGILMFLLTASSAFAGYRIADDATGGDCTQIGTWDAATKTCTLTADIQITDTFQPVCEMWPAYGGSFCAPILVASDYITFDGNGHSLTGFPDAPPELSAGIAFRGKTGVIIKNFNIKNFANGIVFEGAAWYTGNPLPNNNNTIEGNQISSCGVGINRYWSGDGNRYINNVLDGNTNGIIDSQGSNTLIEGNKISNSGGAIYLWGPNGDTIRGNTFSNNEDGLVHANGTSNLLVYNNTFIDNVNPEVCFYGCGENNVFSMAAPDGGNYWSNYDEQAEGCLDANNDGFCDAPYNIPGGVDYLPWTKANGWLTPEAVIGGILTNMQSLVANGALTAGEGTAMSATLETALKKFDSSNTTAACNTLNAFINQVQAMVSAGTLTAEEGQALTDAASVDQCN